MKHLLEHRGYLNLYCGIYFFVWYVILFLGFFFFSLSSFMKEITETRK